MLQFLTVIILFFSSFCYSQQLNLNWLKTFTSPGRELQPQYSAPIPAEGIVVAGWQQRTSNPWTCLFVLAIDSSGHELWRDSIERISTGDLYIRGVTATSQGEIIATGMFNGKVRCAGIVLSDSVGYAMFIARFTNGVLTSFTSVKGITDTQLSSDNQGNILLAMETYSTIQGFGTSWTKQGSHDLIVAKISPANTVLWSKQFSGKVYTTLLTVNPANELILFGSFDDTLHFDSFSYPSQHNGPYGTDLFTVYLNSAGTVIRSNTATMGVLMPNQILFNNTDLILASSVCGNHECGTGFQKVDSSTIALWNKGYPQAGGLNYADFYDLAHIASIDSVGFWSFGLVNKQMYSTPNGVHSYYFRNISFSGNVLQCDSFAVSANRLAHVNGQIQTLSSGSSMYICTQYKDTIALYNKQCIVPGNNIVIGKLRYTNQAVTINEQHSDDVQLYPNPTKGIFVIKGINQPLTAQIYNSLGVLIAVPSFDSGKEIDLTNQTKGIYFLHLSFNGYKIVRKIVLD